jgi:hypothetical protein
MMGAVVPITSSNIESCQYDPDAKALSITFKSGGTWTYQNVEPETYEGLLSAPSAGKYFHANIRHRDRSSGG